MVDGKPASRVKVHSTLTAVSSTPVGPGTTRRLSPLDCAMRAHSCHVVFYYRNSPLGSFELDPLRVSLSEVLSAYPVATGRLRWAGEADGGEWEVKCNDAGVRVLRAKVSVSMDEWLGTADGEEERDLMAWEDLPDDPHIWSPFRIQLNEFEGGGIAIGISCTHMIADLTSIALLFKSWTDVHRKRPLEFPPSFSECPASSLLTENSCHRFALNKSSCVGGPQKVKMETRTFKFSEHALGPPMEVLRGEIPGVTQFDFLSAIFWAGISRIKNQTGSTGNLAISIAMDGRKSVKNTQPLCYFGNSVHFSLLQTNVADPRDNLQETVRLVHEHVSRIAEEQNRAVANGLYRNVLPNGKQEAQMEIYGEQLTFVNMEHLVIKGKAGDASILYEATFNDGDAPLHVSCGIRGVGSKGVIVIVPEGGIARTVHVTLPDEEMADLLRDKTISELKPTLMLST
ncbi:hypothetical protein MLD38_017875 [Melastoma candidum]|uniref:Uncharacterized protein n=1 Tax=Melastoma candidum TaxID=119954 RepID=A0ACB9QW47_9MYRT|nr:hypothetical protein MLD38_017875 [Melastoma candidum]